MSFHFDFDVVFLLVSCATKTWADCSLTGMETESNRSKVWGGIWSKCATGVALDRFFLCIYIVKICLSCALVSLKVGSCCMQVMQGSLVHSNTDWGECLHKAEVETSSTISSKLVKIGHGVQPSAFAMVTPSTVNVYLKCNGACSFQQQRQARPENLADWKSFRLDFFFSLPYLKWFVCTRRLEEVSDLTREWWFGAPPKWQREQPKLISVSVFWIPAGEWLQI